MFLEDHIFKLSYNHFRTVFVLLVSSPDWIHNDYFAVTTSGSKRGSPPLLKKNDIDGKTSVLLSLHLPSQAG